MAVDKQGYVRRLADQFGYHYGSGGVTEPPRWFIEVAARMFVDGVPIEPIGFAAAELQRRATSGEGDSR